MNDKQQEIMDICQEECAEVIQAISKVRRFGINTIYEGKSNREKLEMEMGDLAAMLELMSQFGLVSLDEIRVAKYNKLEKLKHFSTIFS